jgi:hypothetical protein
VKLIYTITLLIVGFIACDSPQDKPKEITMNSKDISVGPVVHDSLSSDQLDKVMRIQKIFAEVYPVSLDETVTNFKRDLNPDKEIQIWLNMAAAYQEFISRNSAIDSSKKQDVFNLLLLRSMMPDEEAIKESKVKHLSDQEIAEVLRYYKSAPSPITVKEE